LEAQNGLRQFDEVVQHIHAARGVLSITPQLLRDLHRTAIRGIYDCAGSFRTGPVSISNTPHQPPPPDQVPALVDEMCAYANAGAQAGSSPIHTAAFLLWRLNWIHPFRGGNGRTSRALSYLALCVRLGFLLPGTPTITEQIVVNRSPYYLALRAADEAWQQGILDVSAVEALLSDLLAAQLVGIHRAAAGVIGP
jgi:Fic family protein